MPTIPTTRQTWPHLTNNNIKESNSHNYINEKEKHYLRTELINPHPIPLLCCHYVNKMHELIGNLTL